MSSRNVNQNSSDRSIDNIMKILTNAFIGLAGGTMLGSSLGNLGIIVLALTGSLVSGYAEYKVIYKKEPMVKNKHL